MKAGKLQIKFQAEKFNAILAKYAAQAKAFTCAVMRWHYQTKQLRIQHSDFIACCQAKVCSQDSPKS